MQRQNALWQYERGIRYDTPNFGAGKEKQEEKRREGQKEE